MPSITEGKLQFTFPAAWRASKFDEWSYYRNQFSKQAEANLNCSKCERDVRCAECGCRRVAGTKGIDILAVDPASICWQIEIKDYRQTRESSFEFLADEVALKVRDTLACLMIAKLQANDAEEKQLANDAVGCNRLHVVLHLEQPQPGSILVTRTSRRANVLQRLKQLIKAIDPHPVVVDMSSSANLAWEITQI